MRAVVTGLLLGGLLAVPAAAEDTALVLVASDYRSLPDVSGSAEAARLAQALEAAGFTVVSSLDQEAAEAWRAVESWREAAAGGGRVLVFLSGHMVSTARESWFVTAEARALSDLSVGAAGVALGPILDTLAEHPGQAALLMAPSLAPPVGAGLAPGAWPEPPQGVTFFTGPAASLATLGLKGLLVPGLPLASALAEAPDDVAAAGFLSEAHAFLADPDAAPVVIERTAQPDMELAFWQVVGQMANLEAYRAYLAAFPQGRFAAEARAAIAAIEDDGEARLIASEEALRLDRAQRQQVQRDLALLGYNPRGIDGIFGPGTRAAITAWQRAGGGPATGYLTGEDLRSLSAEADLREAQLAAEAAARRAEEERADRLYWSQSGAAGDETGLRAYLRRYPDGMFAEIAQARLAEIEAAKRAEAAAQERALWDQVRAQDTAEAYRRYLSAYPHGSFAEAAAARIAELETDVTDADAVARARAEEAVVAGNRISRLLVEGKLQGLGYDAGLPDGTFDRATRRAIRQFQDDRQISVTGFVSQETMVHLLAAQ